MDTVQIVVMTFLACLALLALAIWVCRFAELQDDLWIEPAFIAFMILLMYLVAK